MPLQATTNSIVITPTSECVVAIYVLSLCASLTSYPHPQAMTENPATGANSVEHYSAICDNMNAMRALC